MHACGGGRRRRITDVWYVVSNTVEVCMHVGAGVGRSIADVYPRLTLRSPTATLGTYIGYLRRKAAHLSQSVERDSA